VETYAVEILDGETVRRTLEAGAPTVTYTAADQTADWGAPLGRGDTLTVRIAQLSLRIGRGVPRTLTLTI
jgi:hypothetical protein